MPCCDPVHLHKTQSRRHFGGTVVAQLICTESEPLAKTAHPTTGSEHLQSDGELAEQSSQSADDKTSRKIYRHATTYIAIPSVEPPTSTPISCAASDKGSGMHVCFLTGGLQVHRLNSSSTVIDFPKSFYLRFAFLALLWVRSGSCRSALSLTPSFLFLLFPQTAAVSSSDITPPGSVPAWLGCYAFIILVPTFLPLGLAPTPTWHHRQADKHFSRAWCVSAPARSLSSFFPMPYHWSVPALGAPSCKTLSGHSPPLLWGKGMSIETRVPNT